MAAERTRAQRAALAAKAEAWAAEIPPDEIEPRIADLRQKREAKHVLVAELRHDIADLSRHILALEDRQAMAKAVAKVKRRGVAGGNVTMRSEPAKVALRPRS